MLLRAISELPSNETVGKELARLCRLPLWKAYAFRVFWFRVIWFLGFV